VTPTGTTKDFEPVKRALIEAGNPFLVLMCVDAFAALADRCRRPRKGRKAVEGNVERQMRLEVGRRARVLSQVLHREVWPAVIQQAHERLMQIDPQALADITPAQQEHVDVKERNRPPGVRRQAGGRRRGSGPSGSPGSGGTSRT
jgi:hypothetical protein